MMLSNVVSFLAGVVTVGAPMLVYVIRLETRLAVIETKLNQLIDK